MKIFYLTILLIFFTTTVVKAQQEEYTAYLEQALQAVENDDKKNFNSNITYFSVALDRDKITPEILSSKNLELYTRSLYEALTNNFKVSDELGKQAIEFLQYKIEKYPDNYFSIGYLYEKGYGVSQDHAKAVYWYEKAININDSSTAMNNLGVIYYNNSDYKQAKYWFEKSSAKGNIAGLNSLAYMYENGIVVEKNFDKAIDLYTQSANAGYINSMFNLAMMYKNGGGFGALINIEKSIYWFEKAAEKGDAEAMNYLGNFYYEGLGFEKDYKKAKSWFQKSCENGFQLGCENALAIN